MSNWTDKALTENAQTEVCVGAKKQTHRIKNNHHQATNQTHKKEEEESHGPELGLQEKLFLKTNKQQ